MKLITLGPPDGHAIKAASSHVRAIFFCKLLLSALIFPIAIAALFELPHIFDDADSQFQTTPILAGLTLGSVYLAIGLFGLKAFAVYFPIFGPVCGAPIHSRLWHSTMCAVGLLLDAMVLTPRIFLGSAIDSLANPHPTGLPALYSKETTFVLLLLIAPFAAASYMVWRPMYADHIAAARQDYEAKHTLTPEDRERWSLFNEEIRHASNVLTLEQAFQALQGLRYSVGHLPYKNERDRYDADVCIDTAENHLTACETAGQTDPDYWYTKYRDALFDIPRYGGPIPEIPGPVIDPILLDDSFKHPTTSETLLPPAKEQLAANTNSVRPSEVTEGPFQTKSPAQANRTPPPLKSTTPPPKEPPESTPASPPQKPSESVPKLATEPSQSNTKPAEQPTTPATTPDELAADVPPNPFQKGTTWTGLSLQISDGGINPQVNDGAKIEIELSIKRHDADQFEGIVRCPWATTAQGRRVRWGATASARGTYQDGEVTIKTTPLHVPAGTVLSPGTWTGTVSEGVFTGEFRGNNNSLSEITLQMRSATRRRSASK